MSSNGGTQHLELDQIDTNATRFRALAEEVVAKLDSIMGVGSVEATYEGLVYQTVRFTYRGQPIEMTLGHTV